MTLLQPDGWNLSEKVPCKIRGKDKNRPLRTGEEPEARLFFQSDGSDGLGLRLRLVSALAGTAGRSVLSGQQVVFAEVAGLLVRGPNGRLGGGRVLVLFTGVQLSKQNKTKGS